MSRRKRLVKALVLAGASYAAYQYVSGSAQTGSSSSASRSSSSSASHSAASSNQHTSRNTTSERTATDGRTTHTDQAAAATAAATQGTGNLTKSGSVVSLAKAAAAAEAARDTGAQGRRDDKKRRNKKKRVAVNAEFFRQVWKLLRIAVPSPFSPEAAYIVGVGAVLCTRTYLDLFMIHATTLVESVIISRDVKKFPRALGHFLKVMIPTALVNNLLKKGMGEMTLRFRTRLTQNLFDAYMKGFTYYRVTNLDSRIANADQLLTEDLSKFCESLTECYTNITKPALDTCIYAMKLYNSIGAQGPTIMLSYLAVAGGILTVLRAPTARLTVREQALEGEFRYTNSRLITHAEEVAFYNGNKREKIVLLGSFDRLVQHLRKALNFKFWIGMLDSIIAKYFATVVGFYVVSRPFLNLKDPRHLNSSYNELMADYYKSGRMLMRMADGVSRLVMAGREMTRLAGFTARITLIREVLDDLNQGNYQRKMVVEGRPADELTEEEKADEAFKASLVPNSGTVIEVDRLIKFDHVPLVTPNGDVLVRSLSFTVTAGMNTIVVGPNGCGKSSLFRVLGGLWPLFGGVLHKPRQSELFYVPQRPFLTLGTLRDQVIYPHTLEDMRRAGRTDEDLMGYLRHVKLAHIVEREPNGFDTVDEWQDILSGGEKQRVAMSRLFYHRPQFAILDECTSAVSIDVEAWMYEHCRKVGIGLFTVSHRKTLWKHHEFVLFLNGRGGYRFERITPDLELELSNFKSAQDTDAAE